MSHSHASHRYLDVMTVRPSQGARLQNTNSASMSPPPSAGPTANDGPALLHQLHMVTSNQSRPNSPEEKIRVQRESSSRLSNRPKHTIRGLKSAGLQSLPPSTALINSATQHLLAGRAQGVLSSSSSGPLLPSHNSLLVEPILLPGLHHVHVDSPQDLEESCLFYPNGHKNRNIRREIETSVIKHHILENSKVHTHKQKSRYRIVREDPYANVKGPGLFYSKAPDPQMQELYSALRRTERKIVGTVQVHV